MAEDKPPNEPETAVTAEPGGMKSMNPKKRHFEHGISEYCEDYPVHSIKKPTAAIPLEHFVKRAEIACFGKRLTDSPIFPQHHKHATEPLLRRGRLNRIIIFVGCFNPPHLGHLELLAHAFLRTDNHTVAAMICPMEDIMYGKHNAIVKGEIFSLTKKERSVLLKDKLLERFTWVYSGERHEIKRFEKVMINCARQDGFELTFIGLVDSDHVHLTKQLSSSWGIGGLVTSDITRPSRVVFDILAQPVRLSGCKAWRKILPAKSMRKIGAKHCWPCLKFQAICPELVGISMSHSTSYLSFFGGICSEILRRCHDSDGVVWMCRRNEGDRVWFFPSRRHYPEDKRRIAVSSTPIRNLLDQSPEDKLYDAIKTLAMNPKQLLIILKLGDDEPRAPVRNSAVKARCGLGKAKDDGYVGMFTKTACQRLVSRRKSI